MKDETRRAWGLAVRLLPMSDDRCSTIIATRDHGELAFQDYFVRLRHDVPVDGVRFVGDAVASPQMISAIEDADTIVIAPSNPLVSIAPIRSLPGVDTLLRRRRSDVVAVSPIVGGAALKGPAARMLTELGHEPSVLGVARLYAPIASALVVDPVDAGYAAAVESLGMRCVIVPSVMSSPEIARDLAVTTVGAVR